MKPIKRSAGFTLTELMVTLAVVGIIMAMAAPAFTKLIEKRRLIGAGEQIYSQLTFARNEAVKRSKPLYLTFTTGGSTTWSFGITDHGTAPNIGCVTSVANPTDNTACSIDLNNDGNDADRMLYVFNSTDYPNVSLTTPVFTANIPAGCVVDATNFTTNETCFDGVRGMARDGSLSLSTDNFALTVELNLIGRARMCTPAGAKAIPDYPEC